MALCESDTGETILENAGVAGGSVHMILDLRYLLKLYYGGVEKMGRICKYFFASNCECEIKKYF